MSLVQATNLIKTYRVGDIDVPAIKGIDFSIEASSFVAFVGPSDLSTSLGKTGKPTDPVVEAAIQKVIDACKKHNVIPGIHLGSIEQIKKWKDRGMRMLGYGTDIKLIQQICKQSVKELKALL